MKWVFVGLGALIAIVALLAILGALQPKDHVASVTATLNKPDSVVWAVISDFERVPEWNPVVASVRRLADVDGKPAYREKYGGFEVTQVVLELIPNRKVVREILPEGGFSGTWTYELAPDGNNTRLTITERGHVENPIFRAFMMFGDNRKSLRQYMAALEKKLG